MHIFKADCDELFALGAVQDNTFTKVDFCRLYDAEKKQNTKLFA